MATSVPLDATISRFPSIYLKSGENSLLQRIKVGLPEKLTLHSHREQLVGGDAADGMGHLQQLPFIDHQGRLVPINHLLKRKDVAKVSDQREGV